MKIEIKKFGTLLTSRPAGKEAFLAAKAYIIPQHHDEKIILDFEGVDVLSPSWADEFISSLSQTYPGRITFEHTANPSVKATLDFLAKIQKTSQSS